MDNFSISEVNGINLVNGNMKNILSVGISTNGNAELEMLNRCNGKIIATTLDEKGIEKTRDIVKSNNLEERIDKIYNFLH